MLITGILGQDGYYLTKYLSKKGYQIVGIGNQIDETEYLDYKNVHLLNVDITDNDSISNLIKNNKFNEIYHLAAISEPWVSFQKPELVIDVNIKGTLNILEAIKKYSPRTKLFNASSSSIYLLDSPYALTKEFTHNLVKIYRKKYNLFSVNGILFNHESPRRHLGFITQKVTYAAACAKLGIKTSEYLNEEGEPIFKNRKVALGNLEAKRDWGFAGDYIVGMYLMMQAKTPDDFVLATGETHTIRELCEEAFKYVGLNYEDFVTVDKRFIRPTETGPLVGNPAKAKKILKWEPRTKFKDLVKMMVDANVAKLK